MLNRPFSPDRRQLLALGLSANLASLAARADVFPSKPIRVLVPYSPGGGADVNSRLITRYMGQELNTSFIIENRTGASGVIAGQATVQAQPDGYTMLYDTFPFAVNAAARKLPYQPLKDLVPVAHAVNMPNILLVPANAPYKTVKDFIAFAKANPGKLTYASYGAGSTAHLAGELIRNEARVDLLHVPYKGGAPAIAALVSGEVSAYFGNPISGLPLVQSGKLQALAVTSKTRMEVLPQVPTLIESGFKDFEVVEWNGFFLPAGTPKAIVDKLGASVRLAVENSEVRKVMVPKGIQPVGSGPEEFARFIQEQVDRWGALVKSNHITLE